MTRRHNTDAHRRTIGETARITPETLVELGRNAWIGDFVFVNLKRLSLERGSQINPFASLTGGGNVYLGEYSVIGYGVRVITGTDTLEGRYMADRAPASERRIVRGTIRIGDNCFIGANSVVCVSVRNPDIEIGDDAVVGALSYVDESLPHGTIGWGSPFQARKRRRATDS